MPGKSLSVKTQAEPLRPAELQRLRSHLERLAQCLRGQATNTEPDLRHMSKFELEQVAAALPRVLATLDTWFVVLDGMAHDSDYWEDESEGSMHFVMRLSHHAMDLLEEHSQDEDTE